MANCLFKLFIYFQVFVFQVLRQTLGVKCILALTATASTSTINDMMELLDVKREHTIIGAAVPDNLVLSVSCEDDRETVCYVHVL